MEKSSNYDEMLKEIKNKRLPNKHGWGVYSEEEVTAWNNAVYNCFKIVERWRSKIETGESKLPLHGVNNRTWIVTIECGEDTSDHKVTAPNELAAKLVASSNYNRKGFNILRCVEYGC